MARKFKGFQKQVMNNETSGDLVGFNGKNQVQNGNKVQPGQYYAEQQSNPPQYYPNPSPQPVPTQYYPNPPPQPVPTQYYPNPPLQPVPNPQASQSYSHPSNQYQINASTYAAYPEYDEEVNVKEGYSYQYGSVKKGWNDPPVKPTVPLSGVVMSSSEIVGIVVDLMKRVKSIHPSKQRIVDDTEKRMDVLIDQLGST